MLDLRRCITYSLHRDTMKPHKTVAALLLSAIQTTAAFATDENVEGVFHHTDKTVNIYEAQDLAEAASDKYNFTVYLHNSIHVTEAVPHYDGLLNDAPCWDSSLFNGSNYVFKPGGSADIDLTFAPTTTGTKAGKVVRNGRAEFHNLRNLSFSGITNLYSDTGGTYDPFQPYTSADSEQVEASDIISAYGYGGLFKSDIDHEGGVGIYDCYGSICFADITYDASRMGDMDCSIQLTGGVIYADDSCTTEIKNNGINTDNTADGLCFSNVYIALDRSEYATSSSCNFSAYGGAIRTPNLCIDANYGAVSFSKVGIRQIAVDHDKGYGYGGALYLNGSANSISGNTGSILFDTCTISVANEAQGGAICLVQDSTLNICDNKQEVTFSSCQAAVQTQDGWLDTAATAQGGAIYLGSNDTLNIQNNGDVNFSLNSAAATATQVASAATAQGGAIYLADNATLNIQNNGNVYISLNSAAATATQADSSATAQGGAIYGSSGSHIRICDNKNVIFAENSAPVGSAIYTQGDVTICNNAGVTFSENSGDYAVYMGNSDSRLTLSGDISFQDALYTAGSVDFNAPYNEAAQTGEIEFYGTAAHIAGSATLHHGTLALRGGSTFSAKLNLASPATLAAEGAGNSISHFDLGENSTLALTLGSINTAEAVLQTTGFSSNGTYTLNITFQGRPKNGEDYILLELMELPYADNAWNEDTVRITGDVSFSDLVWTNDYTRLVYRAIPEPGSTTLALVALSALAARRRRK